MSLFAMAASWTGLGSRNKVKLAERLVHASTVSLRRSFSTQTNGEVEVAQLTGRGVVRFAGRDTLKYLQGLVTNDTNLLTPTNGDQTLPMYAAFLHAQGRFLHDIVIHPQHSPDGTPVLLGDVDRQRIPELLAHLKKYKLRAKVDIGDVSEEYSVWARHSTVGAELSAVGGEGPWKPDPRLKELGMRGVFHNDARPGETPSSAEEQQRAEYTYFLWRLKHGVAEGPVEIPSEEALPLEYNLAGLNAISFKKGCYLGQELTARSHFRGQVRKRVMPVAFEDRTPVAEVGLGCATTYTTAIVAGNSVFTGHKEKKIGRLTAVTKDLTGGFALLRLQQALDPSSELRVEDSEVLVHATRPHWWPAQWGIEDAAAE